MMILEEKETPLGEMFRIGDNKCSSPAQDKIMRITINLKNHQVIEIGLSSNSPLKKYHGNLLISHSFHKNLKQLTKEIQFKSITCHQVSSRIMTILKIKYSKLQLSKSH